MKILLLDNFDSFTYNLVHLIEKNRNVNVHVIRNNFTEDISFSDYHGIVLSPGPGLPAESGRLKEVIAKTHQQIPLLGVCLGHQAIGEFFGASLKNLNRVMHGVSSEMQVLEKDNLLFRNMPEKFKGGHYHSWVIDEKTIPKELKITATDSNGNIMALSHKTLPVHGVQFHPESVLTEYGDVLMSNWIRQLNNSRNV